MAELPTIAQNLLNRETFYVIGNIFSIASFILSIFVLWNIRKLRNTYRLRARGPSLLRDLSKAASNLSKFMNAYDDFLPQITEELGRIAVKLHSLKRKLSGDPKRSAKRTLMYIDQCEVNVQNEEQVRLVYVEIVKVIEELKDYQKDLDWEM
jgi:hypothetical protein